MYFILILTIYLFINKQVISMLNNISPVDNLLCPSFVFVGSLAIFAEQQ